MHAPGHQVTTFDLGPFIKKKEEETFEFNSSADISVSTPQ